MPVCLFSALFPEKSRSGCSNTTATRRNHFWPLDCRYFRRVATCQPMPNGTPFEAQSVARSGTCLKAPSALAASDSAIRNPTANAFAKFFAGYPDIRTIAFNGQKARSLFRTLRREAGRHMRKAISRMLDLPSSSPPIHKAVRRKARGLACDAGWAIIACSIAQNFRAK